LRRVAGPPGEDDRLQAKIPIAVMFALCAGGGLVAGAGNATESRGAALAQWVPVPPPRAVMAPQAKTKLVEFENAPFPFEGINPRTGRPFLDIEPASRPAAERIQREQQVFSDQRVLLHIPEGFDLRRPGLIVVFFHGHRATIGRDVLSRQKVAEQITKSRANAVLVAPQFAVNAADSSAGGFWEPELFRLFLEECSEQLALLHGEPGAVRTFDRMPVIIVGYSGGYYPTAWAIYHSAANKRIRGVVLLDALYGELDKFEKWIKNDRTRFFVSGYLGSTRARNLELRRILAEQNIPIRSALEPQLKGGSVVFIAGGPGENHTDYVTRAWTHYPIADLLNRLPEYRRQ
jgi:hypothetical protein